MHWRGALALSSRTLEHLFKHHFLTFANAQGCCKSAAIVQCDKILSGIALRKSILDYSILGMYTQIFRSFHKQNILFRLQLSFPKIIQFHSKIDLILRKYNFVSKDKKEKQSMRTLSAW